MVWVIVGGGMSCVCTNTCMYAFDYILMEKLYILLSSCGRRVAVGGMEGIVLSVSIHTCVCVHVCVCVRERA